MLFSPCGWGNAGVASGTQPGAEKWLQYVGLSPTSGKLAPGKPNAVYGCSLLTQDKSWLLACPLHMVRGGWLLRAHTPFTMARY